MLTIMNQINYFITVIFGISYICVLHNFDMEKSFMFMFNDGNIPETVERFLCISDEEIMELLKLNFD